MKLYNFRSISLERTACYGMCPIYKVIINRNGIVSYYGEGFVKKKGLHQWQISKEAVCELDKIINKYRYFYIRKLKSDELEYTCQSSCITRIESSSGKVRKMDHYEDSPEWPSKLTEFENEVDRIIEIENYIGEQLE